jgi:hypothetical protein
MIPIPKYPYLDTFVCAKELFADPIKVLEEECISIGNPHLFYLAPPSSNLTREIADITFSDQFISALGHSNSYNRWSLISAHADGGHLSPSLHSWQCCFST